MIFVVYLLSFVAISVVDALWHLVLFTKQYSQSFGLAAQQVGGSVDPQFVSGILSQLLLVATTLFLVLYKTGGHPKFATGALIGASCGILAISTGSLANYSLMNNWGLEVTILEVLLGPILGAIGGITIAYLGRKLLH